MRRRGATGSMSRLPGLFGLSMVVAIAGLMFVFSHAAAASVTTPLVSTAASSSTGGSVANGTVLNVTFNETPVLAGSYSLTLADGSHVATLSSTAGSLSAAANGTSIAFTVHGTTGLSSSVLEIVGSTGVNDASGNPWDLVASGQIDKSFVLSSGDQVTVNYNSAVTVAASYSLTLSEGSGSAVISNSDSTVAGSGTATLTFTLTGDPSGSVAADGPTVTASTGITATPAPTVTSVSVNVALSTACANIGVTRVFNGSNCDIGFNKAGPVAPDVYDVIPLPTQDLPGPPNDAAPEVITSCQAGSSDVAYDVNTGAELGANPCGNNPPGEASIGNTNSNTLDYIPTPKLVSFQEVGVVETIPGSTYVSATSVPPQISGITVNGNQATFSYYGNVVCQASSGSSDSDTYSSYTYVTPYTKTNLVPGDLVYPIAITCPSGSGSNSVTLTYPARSRSAPVCGSSSRGSAPGTTSSERRAARSPTSARPRRAPTRGRSRRSRRSRPSRPRSARAAADRWGSRWPRPARSAAASARQRCPRAPRHSRCHRWRAATGRERSRPAEHQHDDERRVHGDAHRARGRGNSGRERGDHDHRARRTAAASSRVAADDLRCGNRGADVDRGPRLVVERSHQLHLPMAALQQLREQLSGDRRCDRPDVRADGGRRGSHAHGAGDRQQRLGSRKSSDLERDRRRARFAVRRQEDQGDAEHATALRADQLEAPQRNISLQGQGKGDRFPLCAGSQADTQGGKDTVAEVLRVPLAEDVQASEGRQLRVLRARRRTARRAQDPRHLRIQDQIAPQIDAGASGRGSA